MALPKRHRLRRRQDFSTVYRLGLRRSTTHLTLRALRFLPKSSKLEPDNGSTKVENQPTRLGVSISQKVSKRAVVRNRIKRQIHAAFRQILPHIDSGWRLVVVVQPEAAQCDYEQFLRELKQLLKSAEVINGY